MKKLYAVDYNGGKHFVLVDKVEDWNWERKEIDTAWVVGEGLKGHVEKSRYFGIPAFIGQDKELLARIEVIEKQLDMEESGK